MQKVTEYVSLKEAAKMLGVPYQTVWYHFVQGRIPTHDIAGRHLIQARVLRGVLDGIGYRPRTRTAR